jgi:hypothetical protein
MLIDCSFFQFVLFLFLFVVCCFLLCFFLYDFHVCVKDKLLFYVPARGGLVNWGGFPARVFTLYHVYSKPVYHVHVKGGLIIYIINPVRLYPNSFPFFPPLIIYIILIFERHILFSLIFTAVNIECIQKELI